MHNDLYATKLWYSNWTEQTRNGKNSGRFNFERSIRENSQPLVFGILFNAAKLSQS